MNDPQFEAGHKGYDDTPRFSPEPPPAQRGCFFYGCIFALVLALIGLILGGALLYTGYFYWMKLVEDYTSTTPAEIKKLELPDEQRKALDERIEAFKKANNEGKDFELILTADDINALINEHEDFKGKGYITIKGDQVTGELSIPLGDSGLPGTKGRYLNGSATLKPSIKNGDLDVRIQDLTVNGKAIPPNIKTSLSSENIAKDFKNNPKNAKLIENIESFEIKDDKVFIKLKAKAKSEEGATKVEDAKAPKDDSPKKDEAKEPVPPKDEAKPKEPAGAKSAA